MDQNYNERPDERMSSEAPARQKKKKKRSVGRIIAKTFGWIFLTLFTICVIGVLTIGIFAKIFMTYVDTTLIPSLGEVTSEEMQLALASTIYDKNGTPILTLYDNSDDTGGNRELVKYSEIPKHLVNALVSIEDHRFYPGHPFWREYPGRLHDHPAAAAEDVRRHGRHRAPEVPGDLPGSGV